MTDTAARLTRAMATTRQRLWGNPRDWINPRRKRFWAVIALLIYTLVGFFLVPWIAQRQVVQIVGELVNRPVRLDDVNVNPFALSVEARGFAITEPDGAHVVGFDRLYANFQLSSLFRWAWTFREITLERPLVTFIRFDDGTTNLGRLVPQSGPDAAPEDEDTELARVIVQSFALLDGSGEVTDHVPETTFSAPFGPITIAVHDISTLPDSSGQQHVAVHTERGANLAWQGSLQVAPLNSSGRFTADGPFIPLFYRYFQDQLGIQAVSGTVSLAFDYTVAVNDVGRLDAAVSALALAIRDVRVTQEGSDVLVLPELRIDGGHLSYPQQTAGVEQFSITAPEIFVWLAPDGTPNLQQMVIVSEDPAADQAPAATPASPPGEPADAPGALDDWSLTLGRFELADLSLAFEDRTLREPGTIRISDFDLELSDLSNAPDARFPLAASLNVAPGGEIGLRGDVGVLPQPVLDAELRVDALQLAALQPYLSNLAAVRLEGGALTATTTLRVTPEDALAASGELALEGLSVTDLVKQERLMGWTSLAVDRFDYSAGANSLAASEVMLSGPYVRLLIAEDQSTNFQQLLAAGAEPEPEPNDEGTPPAPATEADATEAPAQSAPIALTISQVRVASGSADFTDLALPLPFRSTITNLEGELSTLDTASSEPSRVRLQGQVADYGLARIQGTLMPLGPTEQTDISVLFRNVELPDLTPYTIRFAGREIDSGRMEVDLRYRVNEGRMVGQNSVIISDLALGDKVEHPDAFDLPLGLAIALLKGPNGKIDLDVPVEGDLDDPKFRLGGVIMRAIANVITNIVTSPFRLLGNLVGVSSEDFGQLEFEPGSAELAPPEREKLHKLAEALTLRPQLVLEVAGVFDPEADRQALKLQAVQARVQERLDAEGGADAGENLDTRRRTALESLFSAEFPDAPLEEVQASFQKPEDPADPDGSTVLDATAYAAELQRRLVAAAPIDTPELEALAGERVTNATAVLTENEAVTAERVRPGEATPAETTKRGWIRMELEVVAG